MYQACTTGWSTSKSDNSITTQINSLICLLTCIIDVTNASILERKYARGQALSVFNNCTDLIYADNDNDDLCEMRTPSWLVLTKKANIRRCILSLRMKLKCCLYWLFLRHTKFVPSEILYIVFFIIKVCILLLNKEIFILAVFHLMIRSVQLIQSE